MFYGNDTDLLLSQQVTERYKEIKDHLGNIRMTISDIKEPYEKHYIYQLLLAKKYLLNYLQILHFYFVLQALYFKLLVTTLGEIFLFMSFLCHYFSEIASCLQKKA